MTENPDHTATKAMNNECEAEKETILKVLDFASHESRKGKYKKYCFEIKNIDVVKQNFINLDCHSEFYKTIYTQAKFALSQLKRKPAIFDQASAVFINSFMSLEDTFCNQKLKSKSVSFVDKTEKAVLPITEKEIKVLGPAKENILYVKEGLKGSAISRKSQEISSGLSDLIL